ncbi:putative membrane protein, partial [Vibrio parahaemolyticus V-223/04]
RSMCSSQQELSPVCFTFLMPKMPCMSVVLSLSLAIGSLPLWRY